LSFEYEKQRSGADMQYRTKITISTVSGSSYFGYPIYMKLTIGGTLRETKTLKEANPSQWSNAITYTSPWYTVSNKTTGTTPVSFNVYSGQGSSRSATYSYNMGVDPAASAISAPNGTLGTRLTLTLTRYNDDFTDTITYKCGTATGTVVSGSKAASVYWDTTKGNTVALAAQNTSGKSVTVTFTVATYSGSTLVGTRTDLAIMEIPASVKPSVSLNVTDAAGYLSTYGAYVQGYSKLNITATPTLAYGSAIKTYAITADGKSYSTSSVTTDPLKGKDKLTVTARVTDNRSRTSEPTSKEITVLEYAKPVVAVSAYRCNSSGTADPEGAYMRIKVTSTISGLNGKNSATYEVVYPGGRLTGSGTSFTSDVLACDVAATHNIEVTVTDKLSSTTKAAVVPIAFTLIDYYATGKGISFGKVATRDGFDCAMDAYFGNKRVQEVGSPADDTDAVNRGYAHATFLPATEDNAHPGCYYRTVGDVKEWFNPPMKVDVEYRTVERYMGKPVYVLMKDLGALPNAGSRTVENLATKVDRIVDAVFNTATEGATYHNAQEVSWYVGSYGWPYCIMKTTIDMSAYSARIKLKYTKTTDS
jgi:hypothetical protein